MTSRSGMAARCAALVGPYTSGKTTLLEALLLQAGALHRKGSVTEKSSLGDSSPEARARQMTTEPNFAHCTYLDEPWSFIDCPGSIELAQDVHAALMGVDVAVIVAPPEPERALILAPIFKFLDDYQIPHILFVNRMDKASVRVRDLMEALQSVSERPLVLRQVPIREGDGVTGFVDLVSERAWHYNLDRQSDLVEMPEQMKEREAEARRELLESLADFDDGLLEQLLEDKVPASDEIYEQLKKDLAEDLIVPVLLGSAEQGHGITRLWKALRHETPQPDATGARLGIPEGSGLAATVIRTYHAPHTGKMSIARVWRGQVKDGDSLGGEKISGLYRLQGGDSQKTPAAGPGDLVAFGRMDAVRTGDLLTEAGRQSDVVAWPEAPKPVFSLAIRPHNRQDEVKLTASIAKLCEEDPSLLMVHNDDTNEMLLRGQGEIHLKLA
ncbi:MAG: elongation factor G, partial [Bacteroidota bacterium]